MSEQWRTDVLQFWFSLDYETWFGTDRALDLRVRQRFLRIWAQKRELPANAYFDHPLTALAAVVLFDQFPRNMFRCDAEQFATDHLALAVARRAVDEGYDELLAIDERGFLYLPFEHSENRSDQNRSMLLFTALGDARWLKFAKLHHDTIERFGRFPHRNALLGRKPRADELAAGNIVPW